MTAKLLGAWVGWSLGSLFWGLVTKRKGQETAKEIYDALGFTICLWFILQ